MNAKIGLLIILLLVLVVVAVVAGSCLRGLVGEPAAIWTPAPAMAGTTSVTPGAAILPTQPQQPTRTLAPSACLSDTGRWRHTRSQVNRHHRG